MQIQNGMQKSEFYRIVSTGCSKPILIQLLHRLEEVQMEMPETGVNYKR